MTQNTITNSNGQLQSAVGPEATEAFRLRTIMVGLKFEATTGMQMTRGRSMKAIAKDVTGLRTNDVVKLLAGLQAKLDEQLSRVSIVDASV